MEQGDNWAVLDTKRVWQPTDGAMTVTRTRAAGVGQVFAEQTVLQVPHPTLCTRASADRPITRRCTRLFSPRRRTAPTGRSP